MSALPKWTEERLDTLVSIVGDESPVSQATVEEAAEALDTTKRSVASKLRKEGFEVESAAAVRVPAYTEEQNETLRNFLTNNSGEYTYAEIAEQFEGGAFSAKSIQGKVLSMELTQHVKPAEKPAVVLQYTPAQEGTIVEMATNGAFLEDIAAALEVTVPSVRGKCLSLLRSGRLSEIPSVKTRVEKIDPLNELGDISEKTVEEIATEIGKTPRGVKTMLTRRGLSCKDHDGAARKEKATAAG